MDPELTKTETSRHVPFELLKKLSLDTKLYPIPISDPSISVSECLPRSLACQFNSVMQKSKEPKRKTKVSLEQLDSEPFPTDATVVQPVI